MIIKDDITLADVQRAFRKMFSNLKIEFYSAHHNPGEGSPPTEKLDSSLTVGEVRKEHTEEELQVRGDMSVREFEQAFYERYGLDAQVFRRSGNLWMQTTATDHWTLDRQNRKGGSSELHYKEKYDT